MKLVIAIPALNEEESIESIIRRSLAARGRIVNHSPVANVEVVVVSDGSTDRTVEFASRFTDQVRLIVFEKNRGYGAAIKEAWRQSDAELLGFLDADGTCDPLFFVDLCSTLEAERADIILGCRLNDESKMPFLRRVGNVGFAFMLTFLSSARIRDTASGMRVIRRACLPRLMPLPDGLHFTPAMSARAILNQDLNITEIDMPYHEREGESKLSVMKDGLRFLRVILDAAFLYRPGRPLAFLGACCLLIAAGLMITPIAYYIENRSVQEWMIYRFIVSSVMGTSSFLLFSSAYLCRKIVDITLSTSASSVSRDDYATVFFSSRYFWTAPLLLVLTGGFLVWPSLLELVTTGATYEHWSRFIVMSFLLSTALILVVTRLFEYVLTLLNTQMEYLQHRPWFARGPDAGDVDLLGPQPPDTEVLGGPRE